MPGTPTVTISVTEVADRKSIELYDTTGVYDATYNPTGYNAPNIESDAVTALVINIYPPDYDEPYVINATISSGVINPITITDPEGNVTNLPDLAYVIPWPFRESKPLVILNTYLGLSEDETLVDGHWQFEYIISGPNNGAGNPFEITSSSDNLFYLEANCCIQKMFIDIDANCGCSDNKSNTAMKAKALLTSAIYAAKTGLYEEAVKSLEKAAEICSNNCTDC